MEHSTKRLLDTTIRHDHKISWRDDIGKPHAKTSEIEPMDDDGCDAAKAFYTFADVRRTCRLTLTPEDVEKYGQKNVMATALLPRGLPKSDSEEDVTQVNAEETAPRNSLGIKEELHAPDRRISFERQASEEPPDRRISFMRASTDGDDFVLSSSSGRLVSTQHASEARFTKPQDVLRQRNRRLREPSGSSVNSVALTFLDGDFFVATGTDDGVTKIWLVTTGELLHVLQGHEYGVLAVAFSNPDYKGEILVATASADSTAKIWSMWSGQMLHTLRGHDGWVRSVAFSPQLHSDKFWVVSGSDHGSHSDQSGAAKLWRVNASEGEWSHSFDMHVVSCTVFGPQIACGMVLFAIASVQDSSQVASMERLEHSPGLATMAQSETQLWNASPLKLLNTFKGHTDVVTNIAFSDTCSMSLSECKFDELLIATCSWDKTAKIWKVQSGELIHTLVGHDDVVSSVSFGPRCHDGTFLIATGSWDGTAKLWSASYGLLVHTYEDHEDWVSSVLLKYSSKGQALLVTGSRDTSAIIYCINLHRLSKCVLRKFDSRGTSSCCGWHCTLL
mmetsp:Transcript_36562/g.66715  ORF Transcript_36562/g.66715 Transcript_36562/m.66715 type:complete len:560 (+) Transcript_36562:177-1856(+)